MKICEVEIFGDKYALRADMDDEKVLALARLVDTRMRDVAKASPTASSLQIAVLAALDLASEGGVAAQAEEKYQERLEGLTLEVEERAEKMLGMLSGSLA